MAMLHAGVLLLKGLPFHPAVFYAACAVTSGVFSSVIGVGKLNIPEEHPIFFTRNLRHYQDFSFSQTSLLILR
jgi:hypothetical protein